MDRSSSPQVTESKPVPKRSHSASQHAAEELLSRASLGDASALSPLANFTGQILTLLEHNRLLPPDHRAELIRLASMLVEAMWRVEERRRGDEASAVAARLDHDVARRAAEILAGGWVTQQRVFRRPKRTSALEKIEPEIHSRNSGTSSGTLNVFDVVRLAETIFAQALRWEAERKATKEQDNLNAEMPSPSEPTPESTDPNDKTLSASSIEVNSDNSSIN